MSTVALPVAGWSTKDKRTAETGLAIGVVFVIGLLIVPLPGWMLDVLLATSIASSLVVLLVALQTTDPLDFSGFPALLLLMTIFRLALNVSSTRLILSEGHAGSIITAFGKFVIGGNYAVGLVIFLILVGINFIVITKGAGRVAEVAARFTLDAMPGKQMAIDADLGAGLIDEKEARRRREEISQSAEFYGAMDGASKFVKGDAIAALLITFINIIGGIFIGVVQRNLPFTQAASTYTILTVGEGLVSQIPALVVSTAAGLMVTHSTGSRRMGEVLATQLGTHPTAMRVAAGVMACFAIIPGLPALPFLVLAGVMGYLSQAQAKKMESNEKTAAEAAAIDAAGAAAAPPNPMNDLLQIDPVEMDVGYGVIPIIDEKQGGDLLERVAMLRKQAALELGLLVPQLRIRDDIRLQANEYVIKIRGSEVARGEVMPRFLLALNSGHVTHAIEGIATIDPSFGMPALWIPTGRRAEAEAAGYVVVEASTMLATHLIETLKTHGAELLGRQDVQEMVDILKKHHPALVEELVPARISLTLVHRVLQRLLRERVPIRDLVTILEAMGDAVDDTKDPEQIAERVRRSLTMVLGRQYADGQGIVRALAVGSRLESAFMSLFSPRSVQAQVQSQLLTQEQLATLLQQLADLSTAHAQEGKPVPLVTSPQLRIGIRRMIEPVLPNVPVLALNELPNAVSVSVVGEWELPS